MNDVNPDYVIVGETRNYNYESIVRAVTLVLAGARLIGTNPEITDRRIRDHPGLRRAHRPHRNRDPGAKRILLASPIR